MSNEKKKSTKREMEERVEFVIALVSRRLPKSVIKASCRKQFNDPTLSARQIERYIAEARAEIIKWTGKSKEEHRTESLAFYLSVIQSPTSTNADRMLAQSRIDQIIGLNAPAEMRVETTAREVTQIVFQVLPSRTSEDQEAVVIDATRAIEAGGILVEGDS